MNRLLLLSFAVPLGLIGIIFAALFAFQKYQQHKKRRSPFTADFLRSPGQSLLSQLDVINEELQICLFAVVVLPMAIYSGLISQSYFGGAASTLSGVAISIATATVVACYFLIKMVRLLSRRKSIRLGMEGELAVGQELNQFMLKGYRVYHDFPTEKFNIDHILIGPAGVFAIETKARAKPTTGNGKADARVIYDGKSLRFPTHTDSESLSQAKRQAKWLSTWLSSATGESVPVRPTLALPGWFVERKSSEGIPVINPRQMHGLLRNQGAPLLSEAQIRRIAHQVEQRCRDIRPQVYTNS